MSHQEQKFGGRKPMEHVKIYNLPMNDDDENKPSTSRQWESSNLQRPVLLKSASIPSKIVLFC